jgi:cellulose synthase operon protein C
MREITRLQNERLELRKRGIRDGELFLSRKPNSASGDKMMMRLAELYYEQAQDDFLTEMQEYDRLYSLYERGQSTQAPREPKKNISKALDLYVTVVEKYPHGDLVDDAIFNIGFLLEEAGHPDSSRAFYEKVVTEFPQSNLMPDALMRLGEYYFNPPVNKVDAAISYFDKVLAYLESPRYNEALYRLGWCYYRINDYPRAISYFTRLADDVQKTKPYDPQQKYTNPSLVDESVEYIGLSFLDYGGSDRAAGYLQQIGGRTYGVNVLRRIGDAYFSEKEDYPNALKSFKLLLQLYPDAGIAPAAQNRIVQCHRRMEDQASAFLARETLYNAYREGSDWWNKNTDKEARKRAVMYCESALRDNITVLLNRGQETSQLEFYNQAVLSSRKYLTSFPSDSSAAMIHWNMALTLDAKLKQTQPAFDEYIKISNQYWDSRYQRPAAANAVVLAREAAVSVIESAEKAAAQQQISLADLQKETKNPQGVRFREKMKLEPRQLTPEEERLAQAYDNYIKLFPHDKETPMFLANAGALYYRRHQYKEALRYFNTLLRHFPGSEEFAQARYAIMESYFGKADFRSSEIISRRIVNSDAPEEVRSKARRRMAESIYLAAELLAEEEKHLDAGNEYRRVVKEAPGSTFADLALFNAGLEYDKANEFNRAIETYQVLMATQSKSGYVLDAQNNLAFDYVEVHDYRNAALTYERLSNLHPDSTRARDALFNAGLYYSRSEDWENAIKTNRTFIQRYPRDNDADDAAFDIGIYYRRLNEYDKSQDAFLSFTEKYPDSPRTVEAFYLRGQHGLQMSRSGEAIIDFSKAVAAEENLRIKGLERNEFFAAEAEFNLAGIKMEEYDPLEFRLPPANINRNKQRKKELLLEIVHHLSNCAAFGTPRVYEATHLVGLAYQRFAETWAAQDLPEMDANRHIVAQKEINDAAVVLSERAANVFSHTVKSLNRLKESYYANLVKTIADSNAVYAVVSQDTILRIADKWIERSQNKLTEVHFQMGELRFESARMVLRAPSPAGLSDLQRLVYRKQLLQIGAIPLLQQAFAAHQSNVAVADSMRYFSAWVDLSKQKMVAARSAVAKQFSLLALEGLSTLSGKFASYSNMIYSGRSLDVQLDDLAAVAQDIANMVDFSQAIMDSAMVGYAQTYRLAPEWQAGPAVTAALQDTMILRLVVFSRTCDSLALDAKHRAAQTRDQFIKTQDPLFEEGLFTFESNFFALRKVEKEVLERGYETSRALVFPETSFGKLLLQLTPLDPEKYAALLELAVEQVQFNTNVTWKVTDTYHEGWTSAGFDASDWVSAMVADSLQSHVIWMYERTLASPDSLAAQYQPAPRVYLRKFFSVQGLPSSCKLIYSASHQVAVYLNNELAKRTQPGQSAEAREEIDLTDALTTGENILAVEVTAAADRAPAFSAELQVRQVPGWQEKTRAWRTPSLSDTAH